MGKRRLRGRRGRPGPPPAGRLTADEVLQERGVPSRGELLLQARRPSRARRRHGVLPFSRGGATAVLVFPPDCGAAAAIARSRWPARSAGARLPLQFRSRAAGPSGGRLCVGWRGSNAINASSAQEGTASTLPCVRLPLRVPAFPARPSPGASPFLRPSTCPRWSARTSHSRWTGGCRHEGVGTTAFVGFAWPI